MKRGVRWLTALIAIGVILVAGSVVADVVLVYTSPTSVGSATNSLYQFNQGGNYGPASSLGLITATFNGGTTSTGPSVSTQVNGITDVTVSLLDMIEFETATATASTTTIGSPYGVLAAPVAPASLVCAYAFVSTGLPTAGTTAVTGEPTGCAVTEPTVGTPNAACGVTGSTVTIDLLSGATVSGTISCTVPAGTAASTTLLYLSYGVVTTGTVTTTPVATIAVPVTA